MKKPQKTSTYNKGRAFAFSGILCTTIGLITYYLKGAMFYYGILFLMGMLLGFIGAFFILMSIRKGQD